MKNFLIFLLLGMSFAFADELEVEVYPPYPMKGDAVSILVKSDVPVSPINSIPEIKDWRSGNGIRRGSQTVNGVAAYYFIIQYVPEKDGEFTFPSFKVDLNGTPTDTPEKKIKILPSKSTDDKDKIVITSIKYNGQDKMPEKIYPGVVCTVDYQVSVVRGWRYLDRDVLYDYRPQLDAKDLHVVTHNRFMENRNFEEITEHTIVDDIPYITKIYRYQLAPMKSGKYDFNIKQHIYALKKIPGIPRNQTHEKDVNILNTLNVIPLPTPPADVYFLEIAGDWKVDGKLSKSQVKTGHTFELTLFVKGTDGDVERIKAPPLKLPGFEVDPKPEIQHHSLGAIIKYSMRALKKTNFPEIVFATFNHKTEKFVRHPLNLDIDITGEEIVVDPASGKENGEQIPESGNEAEIMSETFNLSKPLYFNISPLWYLIAFILPLIYFITLWLYRRAEMGQEVDLQKEAVSQLKNLCSKLESSSDSEIIDKELLPCLAQACGLPPGSTADELAGKLEDKELAEILRSSSHQSFLPGSQQKMNNSLLASKLKKAILVLFVIFLISPVFGSDEMVSKSFKNGDFYAAVEGYRELIKVDNANPAYYFNLGQALTKLEKFPEALASFETASRLAPANGRIRTMVITLRNKLQVQKPNDLFSVRDKLRPDQWLLASLIIWSIFWVILIVQLIIKSPGKRWTAISGAILVAGCLIAFITQHKSTYKEGQYVITEKISIDNNELNPGEEVISMKDSEGKILVNIKGREIWINKSDLSRIW